MYINYNRIRLRALRANTMMDFISSRRHHPEFPSQIIHRHQPKTVLFEQVAKIKHRVEQKLPPSHLKPRAHPVPNQASLPSRARKINLPPCLSQPISASPKLLPRESNMRYKATQLYIHSHPHSILSPLCLYSSKPFRYDSLTFELSFPYPWCLKGSART